MSRRTWIFTMLTGLTLERLDFWQGASVSSHALLEAQLGAPLEMARQLAG